MPLNQDENCLRARAWLLDSAATVRRRRQPRHRASSKAPSNDRPERRGGERSQRKQERRRSCVPCDDQDFSDKLPFLQHHLTLLASCRVWPSKYELRTKARMELRHCSGVRIYCILYVCLFYFAHEAVKSPFIFTFVCTAQVRLILKYSIVWTQHPF